jgi:hypothetical protein
MHKLSTALLIILSLLAGATLYLATLPKPVLQDVVLDLTGADAFDRCRYAGYCRKGMQAPRPTRYRLAPPDLDRA